MFEYGLELAGIAIVTVIGEPPPLLTRRKHFGPHSIASPPPAAATSVTVDAVRVMFCVVRVATCSSLLVLSPHGYVPFGDDEAAALGVRDPVAVHAGHLERRDGASEGAVGLDGGLDGAGAGRCQQLVELVLRTDVGHEIH